MKYDFSMSHSSGSHTMGQDEINAELKISI